MALRDVLTADRPTAGLSPDQIAGAKELRAVRQAVVELGPRVTMEEARGPGGADLGNEAELLQMVSAAQRLVGDRPDLAKLARTDSATFGELLQIGLSLGQLASAAAPLEEAARLGCLILSSDLTRKNDRVRARVGEKVADESTELGARWALAARFGTEGLLRGAATQSDKGRRERISLSRTRDEARVGEGVAEVQALVQKVEGQILRKAPLPARLKRARISSKSDKKGGAR